MYVVFLHCLKSWCITQCFKKLLILNILDQYSGGVLSYLESCKLPGIPIFQVSGECLTFRGAPHLPIFLTFRVFSRGAGVANVICVPWVYWQVWVLHSMWAFCLSANYQHKVVISIQLPFHGFFSPQLHISDAKIFWLSNTLRKNICSKMCFSGRK